MMGQAIAKQEHWNPLHQLGTDASKPSEKFGRVVPKRAAVLQKSVKRTYYLVQQFADEIDVYMRNMEARHEERTELYVQLTEWYHEVSDAKDSVDMAAGRLASIGTETVSDD